MFNLLNIISTVVWNPVIIWDIKQDKMRTFHSKISFRFIKVNYLGTD